MKPLHASLCILIGHSCLEGAEKRLPLYESSLF